MISQNIFSIIIGTILILSLYIAMILEERELIIKFGDEYKKYASKVPRCNIFLGILRALKRKESKTIL